MLSIAILSVIWASEFASSNVGTYVAPPAEMMSSVRTNALNASLFGFVHGPSITNEMFAMQFSIADGWYERLACANTRTTNSMSTSQWRAGRRHGVGNRVTAPPYLVATNANGIVTTTNYYGIACTGIEDVYYSTYNEDAAPPFGTTYFGGKSFPAFSWCENPFVNEEDFYECELTPNDTYLGDTTATLTDYLPVPSRFVFEYGRSWHWLKRYVSNWGRYDYVILQDASAFKDSLDSRYDSGTSVMRYLHDGWYGIPYASDYIGNYDITNAPNCSWWHGQMKPNALIRNRDAVHAALLRAIDCTYESVQMLPVKVTRRDMTRVYNHSASSSSMGASDVYNSGYVPSSVPGGGGFWCAIDYGGILAPGACETFESNIVSVVTNYELATPWAPISELYVGTDGSSISASCSIGARSSYAECNDPDSIIRNPSAFAQKSKEAIEQSGLPISTITNCNYLMIYPKLETYYSERFPGSNMVSVAYGLEIGRSVEGGQNEAKHIIAYASVPNSFGSFGDLTNTMFTTTYVSREIIRDFASTNIQMRAEDGYPHSDFLNTRFDRAYETYLQSMVWTPFATNTTSAHTQISQLIKGSGPEELYALHRSVTNVESNASVLDANEASALNLLRNEVFAKFNSLSDYQISTSSPTNGWKESFALTPTSVNSLYDDIKSIGTVVTNAASFQRTKAWAVPYSASYDENNGLSVSVGSPYDAYESYVIGSEPSSTFITSGWYSPDAEGIDYNDICTLWYSTQIPSTLENAARRRAGEVMGAQKEMRKYKWDFYNYGK